MTKEEKFYEEFSQEEFDRWISDKGDETHRFDYALNKDSIVIDGGAFKGDWANEISNRYDCFIYLFEPAAYFYGLLRERFRDKRKIKIVNAGLFSKDCNRVLSVCGDATSANVDGGSREVANFLGVETMFEMIEGDVSLMKLNVEGDEYDILEAMIGGGGLGRCDAYQIQYHRNIENCRLRRERIREELRKTHRIHFDYRFIWESWKRA